MPIEISGTMHFDPDPPCEACGAPSKQLAILTAETRNPGGPNQEVARASICPACWQKLENGERVEIAPWYTPQGES